MCGTCTIALRCRQHNMSPASHEILGMRARLVSGRGSRAPLRRAGLSPLGQHYNAPQLSCCPSACILHLGVEKDVVASPSSTTGLLSEAPSWFLQHLASQRPWRLPAQLCLARHFFQLLHLHPPLFERMMYPPGPAHKCK